MNTDGLTFENALAKLEKIVTELESGKCSLEESIKLFEEGTELSGYCYSVLDSAKKKIDILTEDKGENS